MAAGSYRYVIVGAGSAGCVLANRLSADPACQVVLLEAGGPDRKREIRIPAAFTKLFLTSYDWNYRTSKQPQLSDRELYWPRGKTLGGSSSINGQAWTRGTAPITTAGRKAVRAGPMRRCCRTSSEPSTGWAATLAGCMAARARKPVVSWAEVVRA
jgi:choline dehydrogenase-like flavoprotein